MSSDDAAMKIATYPVREMMIPLEDYPKVYAHQTVRRAIKIMDEAQLDVGGQKSLPRVLLVLEAGDKLVGIIRRRDVLRALVPGFMQEVQTGHPKKLFDVAVDPNLAELSLEAIVCAIRERAERPVTDVMRRVECSIDGEDHILKAVSEMVNKDLTALPVLRGERVVGVVRSVDVFRELAQLIP